MVLACVMVLARVTVLARVMVSALVMVLVCDGWGCGSHGLSARSVPIVQCVVCSHSAVCANSADQCVQCAVCANSTVCSVPIV